MFLLYVHTTAGYQNNASTDQKDSTDDVEDCGTDATSGGKNSTFLVLNSDLATSESTLRIRSIAKSYSTIFSDSNDDRFFNLVVTLRSFNLEEIVCTSSKASYINRTCFKISNLISICCLVVSLLVSTSYFDEINGICICRVSSFQLEYCSVKRITGPICFFDIEVICLNFNFIRLCCVVRILCELFVDIAGICSCSCCYFSIVSNNDCLSSCFFSCSRSKGGNINDKVKTILIRTNFMCTIIMLVSLSSTKSDI